jgi:hypothetical protein
MLCIPSFGVVFSARADTKSAGANSITGNSSREMASGKSKPVPGF